MSTDPYPQYEERIVVYLDILGWGDVIEKTKNDTQIVDQLVHKTDDAPHLQNVVNKVKERGAQIPYGIEAAHGSDTIVVSWLYDQSQIDDVFSDAIDRSVLLLQPDLRLREDSLKK